MCNGSTTDSDSVCWGSNPYSPAKRNSKLLTVCCFFIFLSHFKGIRTRAVCQKANCNLSGNGCKARGQRAQRGEGAAASGKIPIPQPKIDKCRKILVDFTFSLFTIHYPLHSYGRFLEVISNSEEVYFLTEQAEKQQTFNGLLLFSKTLTFFLIPKK